VPDAVNQLLATEAARDKLGARGISAVEPNRYVVIKDRARPGSAFSPIHGGSS
jgi:hypothetical protein